VDRIQQAAWSGAPASDQCRRYTHTSIACGICPCLAVFPPFVELHLSNTACPGSRFRHTSPWRLCAVGCDLRLWAPPATAFALGRPVDHLARSL